MRTLVLAALMVCAGCTTLKPVAGTAPELREKIDSGQLLKAGDRVLIVTTDAKAHRFAVTTIQAGVIQGKNDSVPIDQVASVQKRRFSRGKTIALVAGLVVSSAAGFALYAATHLSFGAVVY